MRPAKGRLTGVDAARHPTGAVHRRLVRGKLLGMFKTISPASRGSSRRGDAPGTTEDVDRAVAAARQAYERVWSIMPGRERARYLLRIARLMRERSADLAVLESLDSGKPIRQTRDVDLPLATAHFFYHAGWADKLAYAGFGSAAAAPVRPLGVVGQVIGWSSPLLMLAWKIAPALACGNTVVLKPAETTPLTALAFAEICADAGLPPGVVNVVTGDGLAGQLVAGHPGIDKVAFTGSHPRLARKSRSPRRCGASGSRSSSAAPRRTSSARMPTSTRRRRGSWRASSCARVTRAARARGCSSRRPCSTTWWTPSGAG